MGGLAAKGSVILRSRTHRTLLGRPPWRARSGWIDRLGRVVAWYWVIAMIVWAVDGRYHEGAF